MQKVLQRRGEVGHREQSRIGHPRVRETGCWRIPAHMAAKRGRGRDLHRQLAGLGHDCILSERLTGEVTGLVPNWCCAPLAGAIQERRGVAFLVAVTVVGEGGDFHRIANHCRVIAGPELTPSELSRGFSSQNRGRRDL